MPPSSATVLGKRGYANMSSTAIAVGPPNPLPQQPGPGSMGGMSKGQPGGVQGPGGGGVVNIGLPGGGGMIHGELMTAMATKADGGSWLPRQMVGHGYQGRWWVMATKADGGSWLPRQMVGHGTQEGLRMYMPSTQP
jgi:hypothetical protein